MYIPQTNPLHPRFAGPGANAAVNGNSGSEQSTRYIIGFCVAIPCTLVVVAAWYFWHRRKNKKNGGATTSSNKGYKRAAKSAWGKKRRKETWWRRPFASDRLRPAEAPAAYKRDKEFLPSA